MADPIANSQRDPSTSYNEDINYSKPDFDIPEKEKDKEWYMRNIRYYTKYYNTNYTTYQPDDYRGNVTPVQRGLNYMLYYEGRQQNIDYNYTTKDYSNNTLQAVWIPGKKLKSMVDHLLGNLKIQLEGKIIGATSLSKKALGKKQKAFDDLMLKYDEQAKILFDELASVGLEFKPLGDREFKDKEDAEKWFKTSYKENAEIYSIDICKYIEEYNDSDSLYYKEFLDFLAANYCAMYNYVENGRIKQKQIPFYNLIFDYNDPDTFNKGARFVGFRDQLTVQEVFLKYPNLTDEERKEIKTSTSNEDAWTSLIQYYNQPNINWWTNYIEKEKMVTCVTIFWKGQRDSRWESDKDKYGNIHYRKVRKENKSGNYWIEDIYKGSLIGNKYIQDYGLLDNVVRNVDNKSIPQFPIKVLSGGIIMGDGVPLIGVLSQYQDLLDYYRFKIIDKTGKDYGKCYIVNGFKLDDTITGRQILNDFKVMGLTVVKGTSGEPDDPNNNKQLIETVDLTLDAGIQYYIELIKETERAMEEAVSLPKIATGSQNNVIGKAVQNATITQSTLGLALLYENFIKFNEINLNCSANMAIQLYASGKADDAEIIVGDRGIKFLKTAKELGFNRWEDMLIFIKTKDVIGDADKQRYLAIAQSLAQNKQISMLDFVKMDMAETKSEIKHDLEIAIEKQMKREEEAAAMQAQQQANIEAANIKAKNDQELLRQTAETDRNEARIQGKKEEASIKSGQPVPNQ